MFKLQILVSTMFQKNNKIIEKMNIKSDAIIINQCNEYNYEKFKINDNEFKIYSFEERGLSLSRNNALIRATGDICLLADDDVVYNEDYENIILQAFRNNPKADIIIFNLDRFDSRKSPIIKKKTRVYWFNILKYGSVRIAFRTASVKKANIFFPLLFGSGAKYSSGEDSIFLIDCLKKGLRVYTNEGNIGLINNENSTWFEGYTNKYFHDKGAVFHLISPAFSKLLCLQFALRKKKIFKEYCNWITAYNNMKKGIIEVKSIGNEMFK